MFLYSPLCAWINYNIMEEVEGFEPPRAFTPLSVFKTDPFSRTWVYLHINNVCINFRINN